MRRDSCIGVWAWPAALAAGLLTLASCTKSGTTPEDPLITKGRQVYATQCVACHHPSNPTKDGSVGPGITGASAGFLEARLLRNEYPEGYKPKRTTTLMPRMAHLEADIPALAAYLNSVK